MMQQGFRFSKDLKIIIYGTGGDGQRILHSLLELGYEVVAFIDKRAVEIQNFDSIPVYTIDQIDEVVPLNSETVVIITIKNVFEHQRIATTLYQVGFRNLLFRPVSMFQDRLSPGLVQMSDVYDTLLSDGFIGEEIFVPLVEKELFISKDCLLISNETKLQLVTAWVPIELVFNYTQDGAFENRNMALFFPLVDLYRAFLNVDSQSFEEAVANYLCYAGEFAARKKQELTQSLKESMIQSRYGVFKEMMKVVESNTDFFIRNAPMVECFSPGIFNLSSSGRNRVAFLVARGFRVVPLKMSKQSYDSWLNFSVYRDIQSFITNRNAISFFAPVPHPFLIDQVVIAENYFSAFVVKIAYYITKQFYSEEMVKKNNGTQFSQERTNYRINTHSILCAIKDHGSSSRFFSSLGFPVKRFISGSSRRELTKKLDQLFYSPSIEELSETDLKMHSVETVLLDDRLKLHSAVSILASVKSNVFYIHWANRRKIEWIELGFSLKQQLFTSIWNSQIVEGYFLQRTVQ